jgi:hypothetical protein
LSQSIGLHEAYFVVSLKEEIFKMSGGIGFHLSVWEFSEDYDNSIVKLLSTRKGASVVKWIVDLPYFATKGTPFQCSSAEMTLRDSTSIMSSREDASVIETRACSRFGAERGTSEGL